MSIHIFGIRHHGPGSARSLRAALESLRPDIILVEGPPEAAAVVPLLAHPKMRPPVALLIHAAGDLKRSVFYPFASYSPEWVALRFALAHNIAIRLMDLPQAHQLAQESTNGARPGSGDPLQRLAEAAGYSDSEDWWGRMVEERVDGGDLFAAIFTAMSALREKMPGPAGPLEAQREAFMRQTIRAARRDGFRSIAVVCGAWHAPALDLGSGRAPAAKEDAALLKGLPRIRVQATWVPWTNARLSLASGYGAGIDSPGWYQHLWRTPELVGIRWLVQVAQLLRQSDLDVSPADVIEAMRLAEALAALRGRSLPGLAELNEATQAVLCFGSELPLKLIHESLIVGESLGQVPAEAPMAPLQQDLIREQRRLRLAAEALRLDLDLRRALDLERSRLLHRLSLLGVHWGEVERVRGKAGTFHEIWRLRWRPELVIALIEASSWGRTILEAATASARAAAGRNDDLAGLTNLLDRALLAELPAAVDRLLERLQAVAAVASDAATLLEALPPLADIIRYGNVRGTDAETVAEVAQGLAVRICVGLPLACASLDDEAAASMCERISGTNNALALLQNDELRRLWHKSLQQISSQRGVHGVIAGSCWRLLLDAGVLAAEEAARGVSLALSTANEPAEAAAWIEGFLKDSGLLLLHDERLWRVIDDWITELGAEAFTAMLPLLRRTFAAFSSPERRQLGERARSGSSLAAAASQAAFDQQRALAILPLVAQLLGVEDVDR